MSLKTTLVLSIIKQCTARSHDSIEPYRRERFQRPSDVHPDRWRLSSSVCQSEYCSTCLYILSVYSALWLCKIFEPSFVCVCQCVCVRGREEGLLPRGCSILCCPVVTGSTLDINHPHTIQMIKNSQKSLTFKYI